MIPERIFIIWLGNAVPECAKVSAGLFSREYPNWDVEFVRYRVSEMERICRGGVKSDIDGVMFRTAREVFGGGTAFSEYVENQKRIYGKNMKKLMLLSDIFRMELLNSFGGIYVDADAVPGMRFDERLMQKDRFCVSRDIGGKTIPDNYFMGQASGYRRWTNPMDPTSAAQVYDCGCKDVMFQYRRTRFMKGAAEPVSNGFYIEHYMIRSWEAFGGRTVDDFDP